MPESRKLRVFLCHASQDKPVVRELYQRLLAEGWIDPWLDEEKLLPGQDWDMEIERAVEIADAVIVFLSGNSVSKEGYIQKELRFVIDIALEKPEETIFIIPVRLDNCQPPRRLRTWQYVDYFPKERQGTAYDRIINSLKLRRTSGKVAMTESPEVAQLPAAKYQLDGMYSVFVFGETEFVPVPAGKFLMGSSKVDELRYSNERPQHEILIPYDFYISRFPVTNKEYSNFDKTYLALAEGGKGLHPAVKISWSDAQKYIQWANENGGGSHRPEYSFRLSTEAEWEKAARGSNGLIYPWGNEFDDKRCNTDKGGTVPVDTYLSGCNSPYGVADMVGNVWEWTQSIYKAFPYDARDGRESLTFQSTRVVRGGSFNNARRSARAACRAFYNQSDRFGNLGFRMVLAPLPY